MDIPTEEQLRKIVGSDTSENQQSSARVISQAVAIRMDRITAHMTRMFSSKWTLSRLDREGCQTSEYFEWCDVIEKHADGRLKLGLEITEKRLKYAIECGDTMFPPNAFEFDVYCDSGGKPQGAVNHAAYIPFNSPDNPFYVDKALRHGTAGDRQKTAKSALNDINKLLD